jgi:hypothetical protein
MAWPFTTPGPPNLDTTTGFAVPSGAPVDLPTPVAGAAWLIGADFKNDSGGTILVTVIDGAGNLIYKRSLPAGAQEPYEWPFKPVTGVKWGASGVGVLGHLWGYV